MTTTTELRYIPNDFDPLFTHSTSPLSLLLKFLESITVKNPPQPAYDEKSALGAFMGPTGVAYLFLHVSDRHPSLQISGHDAMHWAKAYIGGDRGELKLADGNCGLLSEKLCVEAVRACISKDLDDVKRFIENLDVIIAPKPDGEGAKDPFADELVYGRAGTLYLLRMIRHWVPDSSALLEDSIVKISLRIMAADDDGKGNWVYFNRRYIGPGHGDVGIILQLVMTTPTLAPQLSGKLEHLLDLQRENGNFPKFDTPPDVEEDGAELIQWCHGAPGFAQSLRSLRPYFPSLQGRIDDAIARATQLTWGRGLLRKEPNLCHGTLGNSLTFSPGPQRDHFIAISSEENMLRLRKGDPALFETAAYGSNCAVTMNYDPSAAWTWLVYEDQEPLYILYSDV